MRVLSLGAGVQSTTLLLMGCEGEEPIDAVVFADTGWEPAGVYRHLDWLERQASSAGIPLYRVATGNIRADALSGHGRFASMPLYQKNADGTRGIARRQCTTEYKVKPIRKQLKELGAARKTPVDLLIGISLDEYTRMRTSEVQYLRHVYPLVDRRMTRGACVQWLEKRGYPEPQKSACIGCPFRRNAAWRQLTRAEFADAVDFDRQIRTDPKSSWHGQRFLHDSLQPLDMVDLRSEQDRGQLELMVEDDGCGVLCATEGA